MRYANPGRAGAEEGKNCNVELAEVQARLNQVGVCRVVVEGIAAVAVAGAAIAWLAALASVPVSGQYSP